ncbi:tetratricopeptide repeat protein [[Kitasatospora] papulosa]|uniref:tetratricopeptide repeat protein n=1 Tax=[Kitasatospora] papulosa TaxID=1464011 RepID=UPI0036AAF7CC
MPRTPNEKLHALVRRSGWSHSQLARAIRLVATEHERPVLCDHTSVSRWIAGTQPRPPASTFLLEALSRKLGRRITAQQAGLTRAPAASLILSWQDDPLLRLGVLVEFELDPARVHLLESGTYRPSALSPPDPWGPLDSPVTAPSAGRVGGAEIAQLHSMTKMFAMSIAQHGGQAVRAALAAYLAHTVTPWLHAPASETAHRELLLCGAQLTLLLADACIDADGHAATQHYQQVAARLAAGSGDHATVAIALRAMATHAFGLGHRGPAVLHLTQRAVEHAHHAPPAVRSYAYAHLAVVQGHHDRRAALDALASAERFHPEKADAPPGPFTSYPEGALHYQRAQTLDALKDTPGALGALNASLRARTQGEHRAALLTHARLAEMLLRHGHLERALAQWQVFVDEYPTLRSPRTHRLLAVMQGQLRPHIRHSGARALLASAEALLR